MSHACQPAPLRWNRSPAIRAASARPAPDTGDSYDSHDCWIDGVACRADEARFGGIVIEVNA